MGAFEIELALVLGFIWIIGCALIFFWSLRQKALRPLPLLTILIIAFIVRLVPAMTLPRGAGYEMYMFQLAGEALRAGQNVFVTKGIAHPYLPLQLYWMGVASWAAENVGLFFIFWLKSIVIFADTLIAALVYAGTRFVLKGSLKQAIFAAWLYAWNPVTILVFAYQGQYDALPLLLMLLSWFFLEWRGGWQDRWSGLLLGFAIWSKTWPVIFAPIALLRLPTWRKRVIYALSVTAVPLAGILLYEWLFPGSWLVIVRRALRAGSIPGWYGYSAILNVFSSYTGVGTELLGWLGRIGTRAAFAAALVSILFTRKRSSLYSLLMAILVMYVFVPNLGVQSLTWLVPIALLKRRYNALGWYVFGCLAHMLIAYWGLHLNETLYQIMAIENANRLLQLSSVITWIVIVLWWAQELWHKPLLPTIFLPQGQPQDAHLQ